MPRSRAVLAVVTLVVVITYSFVVAVVGLILSGGVWRGGSGSALRRSTKRGGS
jgi:hypothetical protein